MKKASETYAGWKAAGLSTTEIAVKIYQPVHDKEASKAEVAQKIAEAYPNVDMAVFKILRCDGEMTEVTALV